MKTPSEIGSKTRKKRFFSLVAGDVEENEWHTALNMDLEQCICVHGITLLYCFAIKLLCRKIQLFPHSFSSFHSLLVHSVRVFFINFYYCLLRHCV